jgi:SAM-dependent methyltransferase
MNNSDQSKETVSANVISGNAQRYKREFWSEENLKFIEPHFRLEKAARIVNRIALGKECDLLDVGCGPATLQHFINANVRYHGIDIAIHDTAAPNLIELDFLDSPIAFGGKQFDIILAQGVFEYVGTLQSQKLSEIGDLLTERGKFVVSYWNFGHVNKHVYEAFSNVQPLNEFRSSLARHFVIDKSFPVSHNWHHHGPGRRFVKAAQRHVNFNIPLISPALAVEYFFVCSSRTAERV